MKNYCMPILFIPFSRKDIALQTFERIKQRKPSKLYIFSDGARNIEEKFIVENIREILLKSIDWECEINTLFCNENSGSAGFSVNRAINWLFEKEEMGIIIEEDVLVHPSFFDYAEELLIKYKTDDRIGMITGRNILESIPSNDSYCFSKYNAIWGWATWQRAWKNSDFNMLWRNSYYEKNILSNKGYRRDKNRSLYEIKLLEKYNVKTWDYQWVFSLAANNQLCIFPKVNLSANIGSGVEATLGNFTSNILLNSIRF